MIRLSINVLLILFNSRGLNLYGDSPGAVVGPLRWVRAITHHVGAAAIPKELPDLPSRPHPDVGSLGRVTIFCLLKGMTTSIIVIVNNVKHENL